MRCNLRRLRLWWFWVPVTLWVSQALGLDPNRKATQYALTSWDTRQGLPQNSVNCLRQGPQGFLWFGTQEGLVRFDGVEFVVYAKRDHPQMASNLVVALDFDERGRLWLATEGGQLCRLEDGRMTSIPLGENLDGAEVTWLEVDRRDHVWIGTTTAGLVRIHAGKVDTVLPIDDAIWNIKEMDGVLWVVADRGLYRIEADDAVTRYGTEQGLLDDRVWAVEPDRQGGLLISTGAGLQRYQDGHFEAIEADAELDGVICMLIDRSGSLWCGTFGSGVARLVGGQVDWLTQENGLTYNWVLSLLEDHEGNLWIGTDGGGLVQLRDAMFTAVTESEGLPHNMVRTVLPVPDGSVWIGTDGGGLARYREGDIRVYDRTSGLADDRILSLARDPAGGLWIGTASGQLSHIDGPKIVNYGEQDGIPAHLITAVCPARDGTVWLGSRLGLIRWKDGTARRYSTDDGLTTDLIRNVYEDREGTIWIGTRNGGLNYYRDGEFGAYTTADGLSSDQLLCIFEDDEGAIWVGTSDRGLNRFRNGRFEQFTRRDGLFDDRIFEVIPHRGYFWISSNRGIFRVRIADLNRFSAGSIDQIPCESFGKADGMKTFECNGGSYPAIGKSADGRLWFATIHGVAVVHPDEDKQNSHVPPVVIRRIVIDGQESVVGDRIEVPPDAKKLEIHYAALSFQVPERIRYHYRLTEHDTDWRDAGPRRVAYYTNLTPGPHTFQVIACNQDGVWNKEGASAEVVQVAGLLQKREVKAGFVLVVFLIGFSFYVFKMWHSEKQREKLETLIAERSEALARTNQKLMEIQEQVVEAAHHAGMAELANSVLTQVNKTVEMMLVTCDELQGFIDTDTITEDIAASLKKLEGHGDDLATFMDETDSGTRFKQRLVDTVESITVGGRQLRSSIDELHHQLESLNETVSAQQEYAKQQELSNLVDINRLVGDAIKLHQSLVRDAGIEVVQDLKPLPPYEGPRSKLVKVVFTLIQVGCESIQRHDGDEKVLEVETSVEDEAICIHISDSGEGLDAADLKRVFAQGFSRHSTTSAMDLHACANSISSLGGRIHAHSDGLGRGTRFDVRLPFRSVTSEESRGSDHSTPVAS